MIDVYDLDGTLDEPTRRELQELTAAIRGVLFKEHNPDGTHKVDVPNTLTEANGRTMLAGPLVIDDHTAADPNVAGLRPNDLAAGTYHNYAPPGIHTAVMVELEPAGDITITGLQSSMTLNKRFLYLRNRDSGSVVTLPHESTSSLEQNRFEMPGGKAFLLGPHQTVQLYYDVERKRWCPIVGTILVSGVYTPTITNGANVASSGATECQYLRVGDTVSVSGSFSVDPTLDATVTKIEMTLPFAATLTSTAHLAGTMATNTTTVDYGPIYGNTSSNQAQFDWTTHNTSSHAVYFHFTYKIP